MLCYVMLCYVMLCCYSYFSLSFICLPNFLFAMPTASRPVLGPTHPPIQWVPGALSLGVTRLGCEADHSPPSSAEVKEWSYTSTPQYAFMAWCSVKAQEQLYPYLYLLTDLSPMSTVLLEKLTFAQLVKKFPNFCGNRSFITVFTGARHWSLSWASWI
jgi:hypothetical protein